MRRIERPIALLLGFTDPSLVVANFMEQMAAAATGLNYKPHWIYIDQDIQAQVTGLDISKIAFVLSIGGMPLGLNFSQRPIYEAFDCPFVLYLIDNILYEFNNLETVAPYFDAAMTRPNLHVACCDRSYASMLTQIWTARGCDKEVHYMPMGGFFQAPGAAGEKKHAIAVIANLYALPAIGAEAADLLVDLIAANSPEGTTQAQIDDIAARVTGPGYTGNVAKEILAALDLPITALLDKSILRLATAVDRMLRLASRYDKVNSLRGLPVDLYGTGWQETFAEYEGFTFCGQVKHPEAAAVLGQYKVMLNFDPGFEDGVHDRVISALAQGTRVITNENAALAELAGEDGQIFTYPYAASDIHAVAQAALGAPDAAMSRSYSRDIYLKNGWNARFVDLLEAVR